LGRHRGPLRPAPASVRAFRSAPPGCTRPAHACPPRATASPIRATHPSMLHTPRLSLVPLGAEHFGPLAAMYAAPEVVRFVEPAPLDRGEAWRQLAMHVGHRLLLPPGILGTWIRVGSGGRVCAVRVRRVEGARRRQPGASGQRPLAACGRTGRGEGRAGNGFARASGASFSLAATLTLSRCRTRGIRLGSAPSHHADGPISRHPESRSSGGSCAAACADAGRTGGG